MIKKLLPDYIFENVFEITPKFLVSLGIKVIISDIDNTLVTYDDKEPTEKLMAWIHSMNEAGIKIAFSSNNEGERVDTFNKSLGFFCVSKSRKPSRKAVKMSLEHFKVEKNEACFIGDQIYTDILGANRAGICSILVKPLGEKDMPFVKFKRKFEGPVIRSFYKNKGKT